MNAPNQTCQTCNFWNQQKTIYSENQNKIGNDPVIIPGATKPNRNWGLCQARSPHGGSDRNFAVTHKLDWCGDWGALT